MKKIRLILLAGLASGLPAALNATIYYGDFGVIGDSQDVQNAVWFEGEIGQGSIDMFSPNLQGQSTRLFWFPGKAAFRSGHNDLSSWTGWQESSIGHFSFSHGRLTTASGIGSVSFGEWSESTGYGSFSAGSAGSAWGTAASVFGALSWAVGNYSFAAGLESYASGTASTAFGNSATSFGDNSFSAGVGVTAAGSAAASFNSGTTANGTGASSFGRLSVAAGDFSLTSGFETRAESYAEVVIGRFNAPSGGNATAWDDTGTDPIFVIGSGTSANDRRNAMVVLKNGDVQIARIPAQGDIDMGQFTAE